MLKKQQPQTLKYFDKIYLKWHKRSVLNKRNSFGSGNERNNFVLKIIKKLKLKRHLDLGCGTGELIKSSSSFSNESIGIDFSEKMILFAKKNYGENKKRKYQIINTKEFLKNNKKNFNLISANGFFEYFSTIEMINLFNDIYKNLSKDGYFIGSFRNRLFNIYSLNEFSLNELKANNLSQLMQEAIMLNNYDLKTLFKKKKSKKVKLNKIKHPITGGHKVNVRNQYTPLEISNKLMDIGFSIKYIFPINLHMVNPTVVNLSLLKPKIKDDKVFKDLKKISLKVYRNDTFNSLLYQSSTFMILAKKN